MLDIRLIREQPDAVKAGLATVGVESAEVDGLLALDAQRRAAIQKVESLKAERTKASKRIGGLKDPKEREAAIAAQQGVGDAIAAAEAALAEVEVRFEAREVFKANNQVALSFKEFELLKYLIEHFFSRWSYRLNGEVRWYGERWRWRRHLQH